MLRGNCDTIGYCKKFTSVKSYRQNLLPTSKAFPEKLTTCRLDMHTKYYYGKNVCNSTKVLQEAQLQMADVAVRKQSPKSDHVRF